MERERDDGGDGEGREGEGEESGGGRDKKLLREEMSGASCIDDLAGPPQLEDAPACCPECETRRDHRPAKRTQVSVVLE